MLAATVCLGVGMGMGMGGCARERNEIADAFATNRLRALARSVEQAKGAARRAEVELIGSVALMAELGSHTDRDGAFVEGRRGQAQARGRVSTSVQRLGNVQTNASALLEEWAREAKSFSDAELKGSSRAELKDLRTRWEPLARAGAELKRAYPAILTVLSDDTLSLKHRRTALGSKLDMPDATRRDEALAEVVRWTAEYQRQADDFLESLPESAVE